MILEEAMKYLREGYRIYRLTEPEKGSLCAKLDMFGQVEVVYGSFHLTVFDVLAGDWAYCDKNLFPDDIHEEV